MNHKGLWAGLGLVVGCVAGFCIACKTMQVKYREEADREIATAKENYRRKAERKAAAEAPAEKPLQAYATKLNEAGYAQKTRPEPKPAKPFVIRPEEFGANEDYEQITLTYYSDGVVTYEDDRAMDTDDVEAAIGKESLNHFGEYEADSVYVQNDEFKVYYEVLLDVETYAEVVRKKPYLLH